MSTFFADRWNGIRSHALVEQNAECNRIDLDQAQGGRVPIAAPGVFVDFIDQFLDGGLSIADHVSRFATGSGDEFTADDEHAVIVTWCMPLDDDRATFFAGGFVGRHDLFFRL